MKAKENDKKLRAKIKYWLDIYEVSRKELSDKLGVTVDALNGWLATRPIPPARAEEIRAFFEKYEEPERKAVIGTVLSDEELALARRAAALLDMSFEDFFREALLRQAKKDLGEE